MLTNDQHKKLNQKEKLMQQYADVEIKIKTITVTKKISNAERLLSESTLSDEMRAKLELKKSSLSIELKDLQSIPIMNV